MKLFKLVVFFKRSLISDLRMPAPSENRQSLRVQRRRLEADLREAASDNDKGEASNADKRREIELKKLLIAALQGCPLK